MVAQIREIAALISKGRWIVGVTEHKMAVKWNVSVGAIRQRASEARRLVQNSFGDLEDLRTDVLAQLAGIAQEQRRKEPRTAVAALLGVAAVTGLIVTHRVDTRDAKPGKHLSPADRRAEIARIRAQLDEADEDARRELEGTIDVPFEGPGTTDE